MNKFKSMISVATITIVVLCGHRSASAQANKTEYHGFETLVQPISPGKQWITADSVLHIRNLQTLFLDSTNDSRVSGEVLVTVNANFKLAPPPVLGYGPMGGPIRVQNAVGSWVGTWVGTRTDQGHSFIRAVMRGEGVYKGLHAKATYVRQTPVPTEPFVIKGVIIGTAK